MTRNCGGGRRSSPSNRHSSRMLAVSRRNGMRSPVESAPVDASKAATDVGGDAAKHGRNIETAFNRQIKHSGVGQRTYPEHIPTLETDAAVGFKTRTDECGAFGKDFDGSLAAHDGDPHRVS